MDLEWRKIGDSPMLGSVLSQVEMIHNAKLERAGNSGGKGDVPLSLSNS